MSVAVFHVDRVYWQDGYEQKDHEGEHREKAKELDSQQQSKAIHEQQKDVHLMRYTRLHLLVRKHLVVFKVWVDLEALFCRHILHVLCKRFTIT